MILFPSRGLFDDRESAHLNADAFAQVKPQDSLPLLGDCLLLVNGRQEVCATLLPAPLHCADRRSKWLVRVGAEPFAEAREREGEELLKPRAVQRRVGWPRCAL